MFGANRFFRTLAVLGWPATLWFLFFIAGPVLLSVLTSFQSRGTYGGIDWNWQGASFARILDPVYLRIFFQSFLLASTTTFSSFVIGFCVAWAMATAPVRTRTVWIGIIVIPFLLNLIIRVHAIRIFVGYDGPLMSVFRYWGIGINPFVLSQNQFLVFYGMITSYLPFMVFPLYAAFEKFDYTYIEANYDLGGGHWQAAWQILIPSMRPAIASGALMVFVPALGEFVIPDLLGGAKNMLIGNLITEQFLKARDWPFGAALTIVLILILSVFSWLILSWGHKKPGGVYGKG
jgi:spermidine/putrescine transport system permease protein